jgi:hypothetical protein
MVRMGGARQRGKTAVIARPAEHWQTSRALFWSWIMPRAATVRPWRMVLARGMLRTNCQRLAAPWFSATSCHSHSKPWTVRSPCQRNKHCV